MTVPAARLARPGVVLVSAAVSLICTARVLADSPAPSVAAVGDPRGGQPAGFAGDPGLAIAVVALIAAVTIVATLAWVRATGPATAEADRDDDAAG